MKYETKEAAIRALYWLLTGLLFGTLLALLLVKPAHADEDTRHWTAGDTAFQAVFLVELAIDRGQTASINDHHLEEIGWARSFIGPHPSAGQINRYFATCAIVHTAIAYILPKPYRTIWQSFWVGVETNTIKSNVNVGISVRF